MAFYFYSALFAIGLVMTVRAVLQRDWDGVANYTILSGFSLITVLYQLWWSQVNIVLQIP